MPSSRKGSKAEISLVKKGKTPEEKPKPKKKPGRKAHQVTEQNRNLVQFGRIAGMTVDRIAAALGVDVSTMYKYYKDDLDEGGADLNSKVIGKLYEQCMAGQVPALIFWAKARMGWSDKGFEKADKEIVVTVKRSKKQHNADEIEQALLNESES